MFEGFITEYGLLAIFLMMSLNGLLSIPSSEIVLPLAGLLALTTNVSIIETLLASIGGNLLGTTILFFLGWKAGPSSVPRFRSWVATMPWLNRRLRKMIPNDRAINEVTSLLVGPSAYWVGIVRCLPYIRSIISFPAGMIQMPVVSFLVYSFVGITIWAVAWEMLGYFAGMSWKRYSTFATVGMTICLLTLVFYLERRFRIVLSRRYFSEENELINPPPS